MNLGYNSRFFGEIAEEDGNRTLVVNGTLTFDDGIVDSGTLEARGTVQVNSTYAGGTARLEFSGSQIQQFLLPAAAALFDAA